MEVKLLVAQSLSTNFVLMRHFALWGPLIGCTLFLFFLHIDSSPMGIPEFTLFIFAIPVAYLIGFIPAGLSGFILGFFRPNSLQHAIGLASLISGLTLLACVIIFDKFCGQTAQFDIGLLFFGGLGAIAGAGASFLHFRKLVFLTP